MRLRLRLIARRVSLHERTAVSEIEVSSGGEDEVAKSDSHAQCDAQLPNATWPNAIDIGASTELDNTSARKNGRRLAMVSIAVVLIAAIVGGVFLFGGSSSDADAAVIRAVDHALGGNTASISVSEQVTVAGTSVDLSGTGDIDFAHDAFEANLSGVVDGHTLTVEALYLQGSVYEGLPQISQLAPGKSWLSLNLSSLAKEDQSSSASALGSNPLAALQTLAQQGNTVAPLGTSTVDGQTVQGYSVTINPSVVQRELDSTNLPAWMKKDASQVTFGSGTEKVYINGTTLVQMATTVSESTTTAGVVSVNESLDFSNYGTPVTITAPPSKETLPFSQFLQLAKAAESSSTSS
jgi:hypothetical protein